MTRWPICAWAAGMPGPIAATMPHGSCPAMVGSVATGRPPIASPPFWRRYWCRSLPPSLAWGPDGHRAIAFFADHLLQQSDPGARAKILALLATDKASRLTKTDIGSEATWADALREKSEEARDATSAWHSTRLNADNPNLASACFGRKPLPEGYPASHGPRDNCSVDKILQFEVDLDNPDTA